MEFMAAGVEFRAPVAELIYTLSFSLKLKDIFYRGFGNVRKGFFGQEGLVGGYDDIRHGDQPCKYVIGYDMT